MKLSNIVDNGFTGTNSASSAQKECNGEEGGRRLLFWCCLHGEFLMWLHELILVNVTNKLYTSLKGYCLTGKLSEKVVTIYTDSPEHL